MRSHFARIAALIACATCASVDAMTYVMPTDAALIDQADGVVVVEVLGEGRSPLPDQAVYTVRTRNTLAGPPAGVYERLMVPAPARGAIGSWTPGAARVEPGQELLVAFERRADGILLPLHLSLGVFHRVGSGDDAWYVRDLDPNGDLAKRNGEYHLPRHAARFEAWIAARARGSRRAPDYFVERSLPAPRPKFNLQTGGNGKTIRWTAFENGLDASWQSLAAGQAGMAADEGTMLSAALAAWSNDPGSRILLVYAGTAPSIDTHCDNIDSDGNVVLWSDPLNTIGGSFSCGVGGVLANAGPCFFDPDVGGPTPNTAFEARMTVQDGAECFFDGNAGADGAEVVTHEIGHTLGFAHSCEGDCVPASPPDAATMRAFAHGDGRGAVLAEDDSNAASALYPPMALPDPVFRDSWEPCTFAAWASTGSGGGVFGSPVVGRPSDPDPVRRYSGECAQKSDGPAEYVADASPFGEAKLRMRFYVHPALAGAGEAIVLRASDAVDASKLRVGYDAAAGAFRIYVGADGTADATIAGATAGRWYSVELSFSNAAPAEVRYTIQGAGAAVPLANDFVASAAPGGSDTIDRVQVGWVANQSGAPTGTVGVDAYDSRRNTAIGRLCRGDAADNGSINVQDVVAVTGEILGGTLGAGQPDCTEDGAVDVRDRACLAKRILAVEACP